MTQTRRTWSVLTLCILIISLLQPTFAQTLTGATFDNLPSKLLYFKDSKVILWHDTTARALFRSGDHGKSWSKVHKVNNQAVHLYQHPYDNDKAYVLSSGKTHWTTADKGESWQEFHTSSDLGSSNSHLSFHAERSGYIIFNEESCNIDSWADVDCQTIISYTKDNFETLYSLPPHAISCIWTLSSPNFKNVLKDGIMCVESIPNDQSISSNLRLVQSNDFFQTVNTVDFGAEREVTGTLTVSAVGRFLVAAVDSDGIPDMTLYISQDGESWHQAVFPRKSFERKSLTFIEGTNPALLIDILSHDGAQFGSLYKSNSDGTLFVKTLGNTNRDKIDHVDIERVAGVEGVLIANQVINPLKSAEKEIHTRISFDDGGSWRDMNAVKDLNGDNMGCHDIQCKLHLHPTTSNHNFGQTASSQSAIGVLMGVGNYGPSLLNYDECDTFLSSDGGLSWRMIREGVYLFEFGEMGNLIAMIDNRRETDHIWWSKDRGNSWNKLDIGIHVRARALTTDPESTSHQFLLIASPVRSSGSRVQTFQLDLSDIFSRQCQLDTDNDEKSDFEKWYARDMLNGPNCLLGHEQMFYRPKADRECYVGRELQKAETEPKNCPCVSTDYECDYNFIHDSNGSCIRVGLDRLTPDQCQSKEDSYAGSSGYRLVPGNTCVANDEEQPDRPVDRKCTENVDSLQDGLMPAEDGIESYQISFNSEIEQLLFFKNSESLLIRLQTGELWQSENQGVNWTRVLRNERVYSVVLHEFDSQRGYAIMSDHVQYTEDQGKTWHTIKTPLPPSDRVAHILDFHPLQKDWLLFIGKSSHPGIHNEVYVSRNHGSDWTALDLFVEKCIFARYSAHKIEEHTIFCSAYDKKQTDSGLSFTRINYLTHQTQVYFDNIVEFFVVQGFMAVASNHNGELSLYVSIDSENFAEAQFPPDQHINRNTFTVLQSTTHAVLLNVFKSVGFRKPFGSLYKSNENGTFYHLSLDNTNGDRTGHVDFEKLQNVDGIILANQVWNPDELASDPTKSKKVRTMISWDDGGSWQALAPPNNTDCDSNNCTLSLHGRTDIRGIDPIFSSSGAPGLVIGVGNAGPSLTDYTESDVFLTRDGGHNWMKIREGEHLYEFGDQGSLLVLITDEEPTNELLYSWDQGDTWHTFQFSIDPIRVNTLKTNYKSPTLKFILMGHSRLNERRPIIVTVDFTDIQKQQCVIDKDHEEKSDFERWTPKDEDGEDACLLGKKTAYWRRKKDRLCKVNAQLHDPEAIVESCACRNADFECAFGFWRNEHNICVHFGSHPDRPSTCKLGEKFKGRSGYMKNTKSVCSGGIDLEKDIEWDCGERGEIISNDFTFSDRVVDYMYFSDTDRMIVRTLDGKIWRSDNDGYSWEELFAEHTVVFMYQNPQFEERAYFITDNTTHFVTTDKGADFNEIKVPLRPLLNLQGTIMSFHNEDPDYLIYVGEKGCQGESECYSEAFYSHDNGRAWSPIGTYIHSCIWGEEGSVDYTHRDSIFCEQYRTQSGNQMNFIGSSFQLISSQNYFHDTRILFENTVGATLFGKYIVVAVPKDGGTGLQLFVSMDRDTFAAASFPANFDLSPEAYTVLESANSLWIHATTFANKGSEYGTIFTSNSNGTYFVDSLKNSNRNEMGVIDFEKMQGIEGISISNVVTNPGRVNRGDHKILSTRITANAGAHWHTIEAPERDSNGNLYLCPPDACFLNLHCYSERQNLRDLFSLPTAVGLMVGVGNVGGHLTDYREGDVFLTRNAGKTWSEIAKGAHLWEFADQGSLLILVDNEQPTNTVKYTTNEGLTWNTYEFLTAGNKMVIKDIVTQPDGTSQKYVLFGLKEGKTVAIHLDFSPLRPNKCILDLDNPNNDDFELWSPEDTRGSRCLFGRETVYYRRIRDHDCYIGEKLVQPREVVRNCACTEDDFECDYNYVRELDKCVLVPGLSPLVPTCDGNKDYYYKPSGYRKVAGSTCEGGIEQDKLGEKMTCPHAKRLAVGWVVIIILLAVGTGALLCYKCKGLGRIRLSESAQQLKSDFFSSSSIAKIGTLLLATVLTLSSIPSSVSRAFKRIRLLFISGRQPNNLYSTLGQDEQSSDVLLQDYDETDEDADEIEEN